MSVHEVTIDWNGSAERELGAGDVTNRESLGYCLFVLLARAAANGLLKGAGAFGAAAGAGRGARSLVRGRSSPGARGAADGARSAFIVSAICFLSSFTSSTRTVTRSPALTTSRGSLTNLSAS